MVVHRGIVIRQADALMESRAAKAGCEVAVQEGWEIPFARTLFAGAGLRLEPELLEAGMRWLGKWDVAAPLLGPGYLAGNVGPGEERARTLELVRDLRVPVYCTDLIFVARNEAGEAFLAAYAEEGEGPQGFLRALYRTKPRILALPRQWILRDGRVEAREERNVLTGRAQGPAPTSGERGGLIRVEIPGRPGAFVQCFPSEKEKVLKRLRQESMRRG